MTEKVLMWQNERVLEIASRDKEGLGSTVALLGQEELSRGCQGHPPLAVGLWAGVFWELTWGQRYEEDSGHF